MPITPVQFALFEAHPHGVMALQPVDDEAGIIVDFEWLHCNPAAVRFARRNDLVGRRLLAELPEVREAGLFAACAQVMNMGKPHEREAYFQGPDFDGWFHVVIVRGDDTLLAFFTDLTVAEHDLRSLIDNMPDLAWISQPNGHVDFFNQRWLEYTGTTLDEVKGWGWTKVHHPQHLADVIERWHQAIVTGTPFEMEFPLRGADGRFRWFLARIRPMKDACGRVVRWFGSGTNIDEQRRLRHELEAQNNITRTITDNASAALFLMDERHRCRFMNPAAEAMTGFTLQRVLRADKTLHDIVHHTRPDGRPYPIEECAIDRALPTRARERGTDVFVHEDGHLYPVGFTASPIIERDRPIGTVLEVHDLTANERRDAWLEAVVAGSPIGIGVFDRDLRFVRANPALVTLTGLPAGEHLGRSLSDVLPCAVALLEPHWKTVFETAQPVVALPLISRKAGRRWYCELSIYPVVVQGRVEGVVGMLQDVTERKADEERRNLLAKASRVLASPLGLQETACQISSLFVPECADWASVYLRQDDGTADLVAVTHRDPEMANIVRTLFDATPMEVRRQWFHSQASKNTDYLLLEQVDEAYLQKMAGGDETWLALARQLATTSVLSVPMLVHGHVVGSISLSTNSRDRGLCLEQVALFAEVAQRAAVAIENARLFEMAQVERRRADEANRAKDEFLAVVSHELRTPLNAILGWSRMLLDHSLPASQIPKAVETIERNAKVQAQLIEDLLDYARIISGKLQLELEPFDMAQTVESAIDVVTPTAEAKGVRLVTTLDRSIGAMVGDPHRLQQAVWNVLTNAIKFTPQGGCVTVRLEQQDARCVLTVEDTGIGIPAQFIPHVFERFQQADMGSRRRHGGLGLGLAIVRHIVQLHGGTVVAHSDGLNQGATFRLSVPIAPAERHSSPPALQSSSLPPEQLSTPPGAALVQGLTVLVVDDESDAREMLASMLSSHGAQVTTAHCSREALQQLLRQRFDVVVSDIGMPDEDGYGFIERVRALPAVDGGSTPAVAVTAYARTVDRTKALLAGFNAHVAKPVDLGELLSVLATISGRVALAR